jgi:predicted ferric reductase
VSVAQAGPPPVRSRPLPRASVLAPDTVLLGIATGAVVMVGWPFLQAVLLPAPLQPVVLLAHVAGMLAGYGVVVVVGLMARVPALERGVGADRLSRWHSVGGRAVVALVLVHAWAATAAWAGVRGTSIVGAFIEVLGMPGLVAATLGTVLILAVAVLSVRAARRRVSYEIWHGVHLLVYIGVALSFSHQLAGPDVAGHRLLQLAWALLYTAVFALVVEHRVLTPLRNAGRHRMRVAGVQQEGPGVVSILIEGCDLHELQAESGQFFRWRFLTPELWKTAHPFSLSAPPTRTHLRLTVKALGDGSSTLQDLEVGTWVVAEGPYGALTAERRTRRDAVLIAGGVGITPMRALFETMPLEPGQDLLLLYRARSEQDLLFRDELDCIAATRGARVQYLLGEDIGSLTPELFHGLVPGLGERDAYLCGPPGLAAAVRTALLQAGLPEQQLHEERFAF